MDKLEVASYTRGDVNDTHSVNQTKYGPTFLKMTLCIVSRCRVT